jgi:host factor-I protein
VRLLPEELERRAMKNDFRNCTPDLAAVPCCWSAARLQRFVYNACMPLRAPQGNPNAAKRGRTPPPEDTFEEAAFLKTLGEKQKPVSVKLMDGQIFHGWIEYYDKNMVRLTREGAPNLFIFKHEIMYIAEDGGKRK